MNRVPDSLPRRIREFIRPEYPATLPRSKRSYLTYTIAWNLSVLPPDSEPARDIGLLIETYPPEEQLMIRSTLASLQERKCRLYPEDRRIIGSCSIVIAVGHRLCLRVTWAEQDLATGAIG